MNLPDLIDTKTELPSISPTNLIRKHLTERMDAAESSGTRLFLVNAPAGFGKTTLVRQWIHSRKNVCWFSLDKGDADEERFFKYLIFGLKKIGVLTDQDVDTSVQCLADHNFEPITGMIINNIGHYSHTIYLVLDNVNCTSSQQVTDTLRQILNFAPNNFHLTLIGQSGLGLNLKQFLLFGSNIEISGDDLRFCSDEVYSFIDEKIPHAKPGKKIQKLVDDTEGWPALVRLVLTRYTGNQDLNQFIDAFDYDCVDIELFLANACSQQLNESARIFLNKICLFDVYNIQLASHISGMETIVVRRIVDQLRQSGLFVFSVEEPEGWLRTHRAFQRFFVDDNTRDNPEDTRVSFNSAYEWCLAENHLELAIFYALKAQQYSHAIELIDTLAMNAISIGEFTKVQSWLAEIPESIIKSKPSLMLYQGWTLVHLGLGLQAKFWLDNFHGYLASSDVDLITKEEKESYQNELDVLSLVNSVTSDDLQQACELLNINLPSNNINKMVAGTMHNAKAITTNFCMQIEDAREHVLLARKYHESNGSSIGVIYSYSIEALIDLGLCKLYACQKSFDKAESMLSIWGITDSSSTVALIKIPKAVILYSWNQTREARNLLERYMPLVEECSFVEIRVLAFTTLARILHEEHETELAFRALDRCVDICYECDLKRIKIEMVYQKVGMLIDNGRLNELHAQLKTVGINPEYQPKLPGKWERIASQEILVWCMYKLAVDPNPEITVLLKYMTQLAEQSMCTRFQFEYMLLNIEELCRLNREHEAINELLKLIEITEHEDYIRLFHRNSTVLHKLLRKLLFNAELSGQQEKFIRRIITSVKVEREKPLENTFTTKEKIADKPSYMHANDRLTQREQEILQLIAKGLKNRQIASQLAVSINTVRGHISNTLAKLQVSNRTGAVIAGQKLGLVSSMDQEN